MKHLLRVKKSGTAILLGIIIILISTGGTFAQTMQNQNNPNDLPYLPNRGCGSGILPQQFETWVQSLTPSTSRLGGGGQVQSVFNIPVVVHVIHNNEALNSISATTGGNLNAAQIQDQINILNKDFNGLNSDTSLIPSAFKPLQGKFQFNFCLAVVNPTGGIMAEPGIDRINRTLSPYNFSAPPYTTTYIDATIKPATIWNPNKYMNMWVCGISGGILGYATFPNPGTSGLSGLNPPYGSTSTDGLVMRNTTFGSIGTAASGAPYNLGRTATHEIGHWLGLRHIWGDAGQCGATDYCNDTPPQKGGTSSPAGCNYGCPTYPFQANTCTISGQSNINGDMFMNYMDYTNDACMYMFTNDQKTRAQLIMTNSPMRLGLLTSTVCNSPSTVNDIGILYVASPTFSQNINCLTSITPSVVLYNFGTNTITSATFTYNINGVNTQTTGWTGVIPPSSSFTVGLPSITGLTAGNKVLNIGIYGPNGTTDPNMNNNVNNQPFTMTGQMSLTTSPNSSICAGTTVTLTAAGASNYTWQPISVTGSVALVSPSVTTNYTLFASNGACITSTVINVNVGGLLSLSVTSNQTICAGTSLTLQASGATSYTWSNGVNSNAINVSPTVSTVYTVTGSNGSCVNSQTVGVMVGALPISTNSLMLCSGNSGTITATGASNFTWSTGSNAQSIVVNPSVTTAYTVIGSNGTCTGTAVRVVTVNPLPVITASTSANPICQGMACIFYPSGACSYTYTSGSSTVSPSANTTYTILGMNCTTGCFGSCVVNVTVNPTPTLMVQASSGAVCLGSAVNLSVSSVGNSANTYTWFNGSNSTLTTISPTAPGNYSVMGSANGCVGMASVAVGVNPLPSISVSNYTICSGGTATLTATGAANYTWNTGSTTNSIVVSPSVNTTYSVTGTNSFNCSNTGTANVSIGSALSVLINAPTGVCTGNSATLVASGANTYTWNTGATTASIVVNPTATTSYSVVGSSGSCVGNAVQTISISVPPVISIVGAPSLTICAGSNATLTASGASTYTWSNGGTGTQIVVNPSINTVYTATGNTNGCVNTASVSVNTGGSSITLTVNASANNICAGNQATLYVLGASNYTWSTGATSGSIVVTPSATTVYSVTGNNGGCQGSATKTITVSGGGAISVNASPSFTVCLGQSVLLSASGSFSTYNWSNSSATGATVSINPSVTSTYTVSAGSTSVSCPALQVFTVVVNPNPVTSLSVTNASCGNACNGQLFAFTNGGTSPYTYSLSGSTCSTLPCTNLCAGLYTLNITDNLGCKGFNIFSITNAPNNVIASISATHATCAGCNNGALLVNPTGGTAPYSYTWAPNGGTTALASGLSTGCYTVTVKDAGGCISKTWDCVGIATGIDGKAILLSDLQLYPNPTKEQLTIQLNGYNFNYEIYSSLGQVLIGEKNINQITNVNVDQLASGIYIIEISVGDAVIRKKLVKE